MGYTTKFNGQFNLDRPLTEAHRAYLKAFSAMRHMDRNVPRLDDDSDPIRKAVGLPIGDGGAYYVGGTADGRRWYDDPTVKNHNSPPDGVPGLWCQWVPTKSGSAIEWDGVEKFYKYNEWIQYLIEHFLAPWGYRLNGIVKWRGEDWNDVGRIIVVDNKVTIESE